MLGFHPSPGSATTQRCHSVSRICGGERGIRTLDGTFAPYSLSRRAPSASSAISPGPPKTGKIMNVCVNLSFNEFPSYASVEHFTDANLFRKESGGGSRIRTHVPFPGNGFQDRRLKPLGHPSASRLSMDESMLHDAVFSKALSFRQHPVGS